jgi:replicative DNA helicase
MTEEVAASEVHQSGSGVTKVKERIWPLFEEIERASGGGSVAFGLPTGFPDLDALTGGWQPGDLIVVAGAPSMGKSGLAMGFIFNAGLISDGRIVGVNVLELDRDQYVARILCHESRIDTSLFVRGLLSDDDYGRLASTAGYLNTAPLYLADDCFDLPDMLLRFETLSEEYGAELLIVDSLNLVQVPGLSPDATRDHEVATIIRELKVLAVKLRVPIIVTCSLSRAVNTRPGRRPELSDLRDSGEIENTADVVIFVHRPDYWYGPVDKEGNSLEGHVELLLAKNRRGSPGVTQARFIKECTRFEPTSGWKRVAV